MPSKIIKNKMTGGSKKLIDIIDEMNLKEDTTSNMVVNKLQKLSRLIFDVVGWDKTSDPDLEFVNTIMEDIIESPHKRITRLEIEKCNNLYKQYKEIK